MSKLPPSQPLRIAPQHNQPTLSKGQKAFNTLVSKIEARRALLVQWQVTMEAYHNKAASDYRPLAQQFLESQVAMVHGLDQVLDKNGLTKTERSLAKELLCELTEGLFSVTADAELKAIYNKHSDGDFDSEKAAEVESLKSAMADVFGFDFDDDADVNSPEDLMAHMEQQMDKLRQEEQLRQEKRSQRKKTPKQLAREEQKKAEEDQTSLSIREVYRKLVSALHPDREPDLDERQRKTLLMQRVNQAYGKKDLLQLLELQLELEHIDAHSIAGLSEDRLKHFNKILKEQLAELELEIAHVEMPLREQFQLSPFQPLTPSGVLPRLARDVAEMKRHIQQIKKDLAVLNDLPAFKAWLKVYRRQVKAAQRDEMDDFPFF